MMLFIAFGSGARGKGSRLYSIATIMAMLVFGRLGEYERFRDGRGTADSLDGDRGTRERLFSLAMGARACHCSLAHGEPSVGG
jgi:hypothetical protein